MRDGQEIDMNIVIAAENPSIAKLLRDYDNRRAVAESTLHARMSELKALRHRVAGLQRTLPIVSDFAGSLESLHDRQLAARATFMQAERERIEQEELLREARANVARLERDVDAASAALHALESGFRAEMLQQLVQAGQAISGARAERAQLDYRNKSGNDARGVSGLSPHSFCGDDCSIRACHISIRACQIHFVIARLVRAIQPRRRIV